MTDEQRLDKLKGPTHVLCADCPDCGRVIVYKDQRGLYICGKCGGEEWLPAGYSSRKALNRLYVSWLAAGSKDLGELNRQIAELIE